MEKKIVVNIDDRPRLLTGHRKGQDGSCRSCYGSQLCILLVFGGLYVNVYCCENCQFVSTSYLDSQDAFNILVALGYLDAKDWPYEVTETFEQ